MNDEKIIMYDSDEAASLKTITGWVSSDGRFFGKDEHLARFAGSTHKKCECGNITKTSRIRCDTCQDKVYMETYLKLPYEEYNGTFHLTEAFGDKYFFDQDDLDMYLEDFEDTPEEDRPISLLLLHCNPNYASTIDEDHWQDIMPEDQEEINDKVFQEKLAELNKVIKAMPAVSWSPGKIRTEYNFKTD